MFDFEVWANLEFGKHTVGSRFLQLLVTCQWRGLLWCGTAREAGPGTWPEEGPLATPAIGPGARSAGLWLALIS